jgi:hypothetical protein
MEGVMSSSGVPPVPSPAKVLADDTPVPGKQKFVSMKELQKKRPEVPKPSMPFQNQEQSAALKEDRKAVWAPPSPVGSEVLKDDPIAWELDRLSQTPSQTLADAQKPQTAATYENFIKWSDFQIPEVSQPQRAAKGLQPKKATAGSPMVVSPGGEDALFEQFLHKEPRSPKVAPVTAAAPKKTSKATKMPATKLDTQAQVPSADARRSSTSSGGHSPSSANFFDDLSPLPGMGNLDLGSPKYNKPFDGASLPLYSPTPLRTPVAARKTKAAVSSTDSSRASTPDLTRTSTIRSQQQWQPQTLSPIFDTNSMSFGENLPSPSDVMGSWGGGGGAWNATPPTPGRNQGNVSPIRLDSPPPMTRYELANYRGNEWGLLRRPHVPGGQQQ